jgi:hypothetical protein
MKSPLTRFICEGPLCDRERGARVQFGQATQSRGHSRIWFHGDDGSRRTDPAREEQRVPAKVRSDIQDRHSICRHTRQERYFERFIGVRRDQTHLARIVRNTAPTCMSDNFVARN